MRYWKYVEKTDSCWNWTASVNTYGYGCFWWNKKQHQAHRISWYIKHGSLPKNLLLHICDNPKCVNVEHLQEGTQADNMKDKVKKRRQAIGENNGQSRLTEAQVLDIKKALVNGASMRSLAKKYGVSKTAIKYILIGRTWSYLK
jgi:hypothetical protein